MRLRRSARFEKDLKALDATQRERVQKALSLFLADARHPGLHFEKLRGHERLHTIRYSRGDRIFLRATAESDLFELDRLGPHDLYSRFR
jgi:mRNA-degrading endonuclease RelE of RelBE toxin-antitoxin system